MRAGPDGGAVILGGGIAGLAAARLLARHFRRVVVVERDVRDEVASPDDAFGGWPRAGVAQFRHSHAFLARLRLVLLAHLPDVLERLRGAAVREIALADTVPPRMSFPAAPDDEDVVLLACRRSTFEWALRESVRERPGIELREGLTAVGLVAAGGGARPRVTGVRLQDGSTLQAALVVDALGRRSPTPAWLAAIGAPAPRERHGDTGILYYTRFYRLQGGVPPPAGGTGLVAGDLGWVKLAIFPGDADTFSITVGAPVEDARLRRLGDPARFERFLGAFPAIAAWRAPRVSAPIGGDDAPVLAMGQLRNRLRHVVDEEGPVAPGFVAIGDAAYHTNPIYGRGCTMAMMQAALLDEAVGRHPRDPIAAARRLHAASEAQVRPFWEAAMASDRRLRGEPRTVPAGALAALASWAEQGVGWFLAHGLLPATRLDATVFRALMRVFHLLEPPERIVRDPELVLRSLPALARGLLGGRLPEPPLGWVPREAAIARLEAAA